MKEPGILSLVTASSVVSKLLCSSDSLKSLKWNFDFVLPFYCLQQIHFNEQHLIPEHIIEPEAIDPYQYS